MDAAREKILFFKGKLFEVENQLEVGVVTRGENSGGRVSPASRAGGERKRRESADKPGFVEGQPFI